MDDNTQDSPPGTGSRELPGPSPSIAVAREIVRAAGGLSVAPLRTLRYLRERQSLRLELGRYLEERAPRVAARSPRCLERPLSFFVACAEPSGEEHAVRLVRALREELAALNAPAPLLRGVGGERLASAGVELIGRPVDRAAMGFEGIFSSVPYYTELLRDCAEELRSSAVDLVLPVDSPALFVPLAHIAKAYGKRVLHYVTPQFWGWAPWRANGYRRAVDRSLSILPFEPAWYAHRTIPVSHVGHPQLDVIAHEPRPEEPVEAMRLALLPGSRDGVINRNLPWMLAAAKRLRKRIPTLRPVVLHSDPDRRRSLLERVQASGQGAWVDVETGDLHAGLRGARAALSVSGTVLIDLLHQRLPTVVIYRIDKRREEWMYRNLLTPPWFSSVNLLAGEEIYPEFCFRGNGPEAAIDRALQRALEDQAWRSRCTKGMRHAASRLGPAGAAGRAAREALFLATARAPLAGSLTNAASGILAPQPRPATGAPASVHGPLPVPE